MKTTVQAINKGKFHCCICNKELTADVVIHANQKAVTCEHCAETGDKRKIVDGYDCRIEYFLSAQVVNAVPASTMLIRRRNFTKSMDKVNAYVTDRRAVGFISVVTMTAMDQVIFCYGNK